MILVDLSVYAPSFNAAWTLAVQGLAKWAVADQATEGQQDLRWQLHPSRASSSFMEEHFRYGTREERVLTFAIFTIHSPECGG